MNKIIALWSIPRSLSTAVERVFMERGDFAIFHEPFAYAHHQEQIDDNMPHLHEVDGMPQDFAEAKEMILKAAQNKPVFFKDMPHHYNRLIEDEAFFPRVDHTFIIRQPDKAIISFWRLHPNFERQEMLFEQVFRIFEACLKKGNGKIPIVIDGDDLQQDPDGIMQKYCEKVGIPHIPESLYWDAGYKKEWDSFKEWHIDAAKSTGIQKNMEIFDESVLDIDKAHLKAHYDFYLPFYEAMHKHRINPKYS